MDWFEIKEKNGSTLINLSLINLIEINKMLGIRTVAFFAGERSLIREVDQETINKLLDQIR